MDKLTRDQAKQHLEKLAKEGYFFTPLFAFGGPTNDIFLYARKVKNE